MKIRDRLTFLVIILAATTLGAVAQDSAPGAAKVRIGIYDNRSVAIAYAASKFNPAGKKAAELRAAEAAGDDAKVKELQAWGEDHQRMLHFQGFCRVPVEDLLAHVQDKLPAVLVKHNLVAIASACDAVSKNVQTVDISLELAKLFEPTARTLKTADTIRKQEPVGLSIVAKMKTVP